MARRVADKYSTTEHPRLVAGSVGPTTRNLTLANDTTAEQMAAVYADVIPEDLKIPHIGWNALKFKGDSPLFSKIREGDCVYFVHSFYAADCEESVIATAEYGAELTAAVAKDNVYGCQFHPEKSGAVGLNILRAFAEL